MTDYGGMTRDQLAEQLRKLESQIAADQLQTAQRTTERKREQAALRDREARLEAILRTAVEGIITIDERGIIDSFNPAAEKIFGYAAPEVLGCNVSLLMPPPTRQEHDRYLANYLRTGHARIIGIGREVIGRRKDGTTFPMDLSVSEVQLDDRRLFTGFVRDITERRRLEKEILDVSERERRSIGQGLHDGLCQHLAGIELMSQVLEQNLARKSQLEAVQAGKIAEHVREAIAQTRMLSRGLSPVALEADGLMSALHELAGTITTLFGIECRFECRHPILIQNNSAATHLYRIAQEAINNALKHGKARKVVMALDKSGDSVHLRITDNGSGFPAVLKPNAGMGLQIMRYRAGMIGASLDIQRANGKGTAVVCVFKHQ
jgi:two-component system sensor kinase FixL